MQLVLKRRPSKGKSTIGELFVDGAFECYTLEDVERDKKVYGETAIPPGRYRITITMSNRFKRLLPLLHNVPGYEGIRIHPGNTPASTEGCILPGSTVVNDDFVGRSVDAFNPLFAKLKNALDAGEEVWIDVCSTRQKSTAP